MLSCRWLDLVVIHNPGKDFWRRNPAEDEKSTGERDAPKDSWEKLKWSADLWTSLRNAFGPNFMLK